MIENAEVGRRLGAYLKLTGRKNSWLGEKLNWSHEQTSKTLNGKRPLELVDFFKACEILDVSTNQFITREDLKE